MRMKVISTWAALLGLLVSTTFARGEAQDTAKIPFDVSVDPRIELICVIFRLAGNPEYCKGRVPSYTADVDKHFGPYKDHAVVQLAAKLRRTRGVSYDAPMNMAVHVRDAYSLNE